ncbi:MAG: hypothetical protein HYR80_06305 [Nitrospirae bacterium]|nr:hypothetical protein [Nitrospirota bacterium]
MKKVSSLLIFLFLLLVLVSAASANPGFARKFGVGCGMCHEGFPNLNDFGERFRDNGYQMPGKNVEEGALDTGDKKLFLDPNVNFAVRADGVFSLQNSGATRSDFEAPNVLKLFMDGYLSKDITFYSYFLANENGRVVGLEDAFLFFNDIGGHPLDLMFGQYQVADPVFSRELRLTIEDIAIYTTQVSASLFDLTYQRGVQITYAPRWFELGLGLVNGNGIEPDTNGKFDNNSIKDPYVRFKVKYDPFSVGFYGFYGEDEDLTSKIKNHFYRLGPDIRISQWRIPLDLKAQWLFGNDDNPDFLPNPTNVLSITGGFVEGIYHFSNDWKGVLLYNRVQVTEKPELTIHTLTANATYYFLRNLKLFLEFTRDIQDTSIIHPENTDHIELGFTTAF